MEKIKISDILAAADSNNIELDIPATFFLVTSDEENNGAMLSSSSITRPENDGELAKRWIALAALAMLKGCFAGDPKAWEALAYWKSIKTMQDEKEARRKEFEKMIANLGDEEKGEQE